MENWKQLTEFPNYNISDKGGVMNNVSKLPLNPMKQKGKYFVQLTNKHGSRKTVLLAVLVYETFSSKYVGSKSVLKYIDEDPFNCEYKNLKVISRSENLRLLKDIKFEVYSLNEMYNKLKICEGFVSDIAQFSAGNISIIEKCKTVKYFREGENWKKI